MSAGRRSLLAAVVCAALAAGCEEPLDTTRPARPQLTLGGEVYQALCQRIAQHDNPLDISGEQTRETCAGGVDPGPDASPRLLALHLQRERLITSVDHLVPAELAPQMGELLQTMGPLYDAGLVQDTTRALAEVLVAMQ